MTDRTLITAKWRTGRSIGRTIYARTGGDELKHDTCIGMLDTRELAESACIAHNFELAYRAHHGTIPEDLVWLLAAGFDITLSDTGAEHPDFAIIVATGTRQCARFGDGTVLSALAAARTWAETEGISLLHLADPDKYRKLAADRPQ